ncbi:MAG TPA: alpha/beta fold hydrolase [Candidatus Binataceae bacterium]|nr:alpha/beta fold hydrolase [Candidatus Binataceae bacterium]
MGDSDDDPHPSISPLETSEFFFPGNGLSALLIHGLTGTPYEMRFLGERLAGAGVRVCGVKLAGHAAAAEELGATTNNHWYQSVVDGFERLRQFGDPIVVIGQSAGAVLATRLALDQNDEVAGLVLLGPAFFLNFWSSTALRLLQKLGPIAGKIYLHSSGPDIHDAAARRVHPRTPLMPLSAAVNLYQLSASVRPRLDKVSQPTLIIHGGQDHTCPLKNVDFLMAHLGSNDKRSVILENSFHVISVDIDKERVAEEAIGFVSQFRAAPEQLRAIG